MQYRKHWLVNALGQRYDFTNKEINVFLNEPDGFGFKRSYSVRKVGNSELLESTEFDLFDITGELLFYDKGIGGKYEQYQRFIQFAKYKPLEFHYQTPNELRSYHCDVLFTQANKTEIDRDNILHIPVTFHRLTQWLTDDYQTYIMTNDLLEGGKYYDVYPDIPNEDMEYDPNKTMLYHNYHYMGTNLQNTKIYNMGTDDVGFVLSVDGAVENMQFTLSQNNQQYGICKITGNYDYVLLNSIESTEAIYLENNGSAIVNPEQYQDFTVANGSSYLTWCKLKVGETQFSFTCGNIETFDGVVTLKFMNSYATV